LQALLTLGKNAVQGLRRDPRVLPVRGEGLDWVLQAADSLLAKARVETSERLVHLRADASVDLAEGVRLLVPAVANARAAARRTMSVNNLKQIALAFHNYHSAYNRFPAAVNHGGKNQSVPYSWRVAILPFIDQQELYSQYNFDEPWDGPNNRKLLDKMPAIYGYPGPDGAPSSRTNSAYFVFTGPSTVLSVGAGQGAAAAMMAAARRKVTLPDPPKGGAVPAGPSIMQVTDGTSNTILAVEAQREISWTKPEDIPFFPNGPLPELGGFTPDGFNAAFADGSVRYLKKSIPPNLLKALITRDGGEVIGHESF
jgi:prepilin-type processing-associated H-X9-DG protein